MPTDFSRLVQSYGDIRDFRMLRLRGLSLRDLPGVARRWLAFQFLPHYFGGPPRWRVLVRSLNTKRMTPDFALVSPIKSGSSDLASYLLQHPCVLPPLTKEIKTANPDAWRPHYPTLREKQRIAARHGQAITGYFATSLHDPEIPAALHGVRPDARILVLTRDPLHRAFSQYKWELLLGGRDARRAAPHLDSFASYISAALARFPEPLPPIWWPRDESPSASAPHAVLHAGIYAGSIRRWMDRFGKANVLVLQAEAFFAEPRATVVRIHDFLRIPRVEPELQAEIINRNHLAVAPMDAGTRRRLVDFYRPHSDQLHDLVGERFDWLREIDSAAR